MATVRDEMVKYLYNEKQIPSTGHVRYWSWDKIKQLYILNISILRKDNKIYNVKEQS